jgi:hypothetical protein
VKNEYPKCLYAAGGKTAYVEDAHAHKQLGEGWFESPWEAEGQAEPDDRTPTVEPVSLTAPASSEPVTDDAPKGEDLAGEGSSAPAVEKPKAKSKKRQDQAAQ